MTEFKLDVPVQEGETPVSTFDIEPFKEAVQNGFINSSLFQFSFDNQGTMPNVPFLAYKYKLTDTMLKIWFYESEDGVWYDGESTKHIDLSIYKVNGEEAYKLHFNVEFDSIKTKGNWEVKKNKIKKYAFAFRIVT